MKAGPKFAFFLILVSLALGSMGNSCPQGGLSNGRVLVVVAPGEWKTTLDPYLELKRSQGFEPVFLDVKAAIYGDSAHWGENLRDLLFALTPSHVFLVGDVSKVPTIYQCGAIDWSTYTKINCLPSDAYLGFPAPGTVPTVSGTGLPASTSPVPAFAIGRLLAPSLTDVQNYVSKAMSYSKVSAAPAPAFLMSDRVYDTSDNFLNVQAPKLAPLPSVREVINKDLSAPAPTVDYPNGGPLDLQAAVNSGALFVGYLGHGWNTAWDWAIQITDLTFKNARPIPLVFADACETAIGAPNVPWYPYDDSSGVHHDYTQYDDTVNGPLTAAVVGEVAEIQAHPTTESMGRQFTSADTHGAMVYIGKTIVSADDFGLSGRLFTDIGDKYSREMGETTVGEVWLETMTNLGSGDHLIFFQIIGDPSTFLIPPGTPLPLTGVQPWPMPSASPTPASRSGAGL
ncbi:MAG: C25 family cysteine peptidase [Bdellovibrionota bacterium]